MGAQNKPQLPLHTIISLYTLIHTILRRSVRVVVGMVCLGMRPDDVVSTLVGIYSRIVILTRSMHSDTVAEPAGDKGLIERDPELNLNGIYM